MAGLPLENAERIQSSDWGADRPGVFAMLVGGEGADAEALVGPHRGGKIIAGVRSGEGDVAVVVIHVGTIGADTHREGGHAGGELEKRHRFGGEVQQLGSGSWNAGKGARIEGEEDIAIRVGDIERVGLHFEIDDVGNVAAGSTRPRNGLIRDQRSSGVGERAIHLPDGAEEAVSDGCGLRGLCRADEESGAAG